METILREKNSLINFNHHNKSPSLNQPINQDLIVLVNGKQHLVKPYQPFVVDRIILPECRRFYVKCFSFKNMSSIKTVVSTINSHITSSKKTTKKFKRRKHYIKTIGYKVKHTKILITKPEFLEDR
jgi:hypothetical protein